MRPDAGPAFPPLLGLLASLGLAVGLFAFLVWPAHAQEGSVRAKPTGLSAQVSQDAVTLTWDDPNDDSITGYVILRRVRENDERGEFSELAADTGSAATTYIDDTVKTDTTYPYRVKAINEHGVSERSRWFHVDIPAAPAPEEEQAAEPSSKPTGLSATAIHDRVVLTWDDPGDDTITGHVILRRDKAKHEKGTFETVEADTGSPAMTYTDTGVVHQAFLSVDEAGTGATAATAVMLGIRRAAVEPATLTIDRPFIFLVRDRSTDAELFAGRVSELGQPG